METMKKEQLIGELAKVKKSENEWAEADQTRRKAISNMLGGPMQNSSYAYLSKERTVYTWPEIYFRLGEVMESYGKLQGEYRINSVEQDVRTVREMVENFLRQNEKREGC
jgi:hypothetical protein